MINIQEIIFKFFFANFDIQNNIKFTRPGRLVPIGGTHITSIPVDYSLALCMFYVYSKVIIQFTDNIVSFT